MVTQTISSPSRKTPPGPTGYPFVGCLPKMLQNPLQFLMNSALEYGGVVHLGAMGWQQAYLVSHPDHVKYILQDNRRNYIKANFLKQVKPILGENIGISEGETWRRKRRLIQPALHRQRVGHLIDSMTVPIGKTLEDWCHKKRGASIDVSLEMMRLTERIVLKAFFSVEDGDALAEMIGAWDTLYEFISKRLWNLIKLPLQIPIPSHIKVQKAIQILDLFIYKTIRDRQKTGNNPGDYLSMLLDARDEESGKGLSEQELRDEIMAMLFGGFETSAITLTWTWYLLCKHPSVERQLQAELAEVLDGRIPTLEDLPNLKYTRMVVEETMRLYPAGWILSRSNLEADLIGGYDIPARSSIFISPFVTHRLPEFWDNPEGFDPERFAPERVVERSRYAYYPFGAGERKCMGEIFAMTELQLVVAMVAQKFRLNLVPEHPVERQAGFTLRSRYGMLMTLEPKAGC